MTPLDDFKKELGEYGNQLSDEQTQDLEIKMYKICEVAFEVMEKVKGQRTQT